MFGVSNGMGLLFYIRLRRAWHHRGASIICCSRTRNRIYYRRTSGREEVADDVLSGRSDDLQTWMIRAWHSLTQSLTALAGLQYGSTTWHAVIPSLKADIRESVSKGELHRVLCAQLQ